jgi:hypothetical protein
VAWNFRNCALNLALTKVSTAFSECPAVRHSFFSRKRSFSFNVKMMEVLQSKLHNSLIIETGPFYLKSITMSAVSIMSSIAT